jgi:ribosome-associated protein
MTEADMDKSRSQKKRESTALQKAGQALAELSPARRAKLELPPDLAGALDDWHKMKTHEARRRQMQYIGRLMRESDDTERIVEALEALQNDHQRQNRASAHLEALRLRLLEGSEAARSAALEEALENIPGLNRAKLGHLVDAALAEREKKRPPKHFRELFRYLRDNAL